VLAVLLSLLAGLSIGTGDFLAGTQARRTSLWAVIVLSQITGFAMTLAIVLFRGAAFPPIAGLVPALLAGITAVIGIATSYGALSISVMSIVGPIQATGVAIPVLWGLAQGERPSVLQAAGIVVAFVGVVLAARQKSAGEHHEAPSRKAIIISLAAALAIGLNYVCYAYAAKYDPYWGIFIARSTSIGIFMLTFVIVRPPLRLTAAAVLPLMAIGILDTGSNGLFSVASTLGYLSVVAVLSAVYPVFTVILAHLLFHERLSRLQQIGVGAALVGVGMIAAG
jgi:drug/metabolite transporter (DMT)-like permease